jgi:hypothetical protein
MDRPLERGQRAPPGSDAGMRYIRAVPVPRWLVVLAGAAVAVAVCPIAAADAPTLAGSWSAGPLTETVTVTSWVDECGPRPKARAVAGGAYKIATSGEELVFSGPQSFRTDACFSQEETKRVSHTGSSSLRTWKTRCESAPGDPRKASITTVVRAQSDDVIVLTESAHYSTTMATGTCAADVERARTFTIVAREGATSASASASASVAATAPSAKPTTSVGAPSFEACDSPGAAAVVEVRPKRKILRPGEQFDFKGRVLDADGCEVSSKLTFRLAPESSTVASVVVEANGRVKVHADAEPVAVAIVAETASIPKGARVDLEVVTDQRYQELLGTAGLDDAGIDDRPVSVVISTEATTTTVVPPRSDDGRRRAFAWVAIAFGSGTLLALAALVSFRSRSLAAKRARRVHDVAPPLQTVEMSAAPRAPEVPAATMIGVPDAPGVAPSQIRVCPACAARYPADAGFCPVDGHRLVAVRDPLGLAPAPVDKAPHSLGRICPVCGKRYPRDAGFCGQDGVELVPIN